MVRCGLLTLCVISLSLIGCGTKEVTAPKTYPVTGKVLVGGAPLDGGRITFKMSDAGMQTNEGYAELEKDGTFKASMHGGSGLMPGNYTVTISPLSLKAADQKKVNAAKIPKKYQDDSTTPWKITVEAKDTTLEPHTIQS